MLLHASDNLADIPVGKQSIEKLHEVLSLQNHMGCTVKVKNPLAKFLADGVEHSLDGERYQRN